MCRSIEASAFEKRLLLSEKECGRLTVLVVEDDFLVRLNMADFLRGANCEVVEAGSGEAAVAVLQRRDGIDAVFTDIQLGGELNGWDVAEISRATHPDIPVVYTSGALIVPGRPVAGSIFFEKPYDPVAVLAAFQTLRDAE